MSTTVQSAQDIQRQMSQIRRDLDEQVDDIVDSARQITENLTDWRAYVSSHPWLVLGAAAAIGYWIVPTRIAVDRPVADTLASLAKSGEIKLSSPDEPVTLWTQARDLGLSVASSAALQIGMGLLSRAMGQAMAPASATRSPAANSTEHSAR
jgi:hypothetical protein